VSVLLVIIYILSLYSYASINVERTSFLKEKEMLNLNQLIVEQQENILNYLKNSKDNYFILDENYEQIYSKKDLTKFAIEYMKEYPTLNHTYYQYGSTFEGIYKTVIVNGKLYYIGKLYEVMNTTYTISILVFDIIFFIMYILIIGFFAEEIKNKLSTTAGRLKEIGEAKHEIGKELEVTSNDEFRSLIQAYNQVQKNTNRFIEEIKNKQEVIVKQGQLVSIGELAGGVAHDINTPISAIKNAIQLLKEMYQPRDEIEKDILFRMENCTENIIKIVNSMRNQIRNLGSDEKYDFKISEIIDDIRIVSSNEFQKNVSKLIVNIEDDLYIYGNPTKLGQVFTNLFVNAVQAYGDKGGKIEVSVSKAPGNKVMIKVRDYAGGIPENIRDYVFKNILTTKGTKGTGLGLYLAYSVIKGEFSGDITFESTTGEGTTFYIILDRADGTRKKIVSIY
jgi:signal transduction histidine kinase